MGAFHRALLVLGLASATEVAKVTKGNYDAFLQLAADEEQWVLLDFFAPWCGHCKRLNPVLDDFVADTPGVRVAKIDATAEKALAEAHDVDGYPTLRFRRAGSSDAFRDYKGARDAVGLAQLDARLRGPAVTTFAGALDDALTSVTKGNYDAFLQLAADEEQWVLLDFFAPWCGHCKRLNPVLDDFVADTPGVRVAKIDATAEKALAEAHDVDGYPTLRF
ncbi:hypothetical protein AURANDRAFT_30980, partial [Aureococcus anophagefferens]